MYPVLSPLIWNNASRPYYGASYKYKKPDIIQDKH